MSHKTLGVCLITKNEANYIADCIGSIKNIADEIVVVDTGSEDETRDIAQSLGATVYQSEWEEDFSKARNFALDRVRTDWVLVMDADETLEKNRGFMLKEFIQDTPYEGLYLNLVNWIGKEIINENPSLRVFRNKKEYRFKGRLHEQIYYAIQCLKEEEAFCTTGFRLNHYGYDHNKIDMRKKIQRNIKILNLYRDEEKDGLFYFSLGSEYLKLNSLEKAKECLTKAFDFEDKGFRIYLATSLPKVCLELKEYTTALNYIDTFLKEYSDYRELYFLKSICDYEIGKYSQSYINLTLFNRLPTKSYKYPNFNFEQSNNIEALYNNLLLLRIYPSDKPLAVVVRIKSPKDPFITLIKMVNEMSAYVFFINETNDYSLNGLAGEYGGIFIEHNTFKYEYIIETIRKKAQVHTILWLDTKQNLTHEACVNIITLINNGLVEVLGEQGYEVSKL